MTFQPNRSAALTRLDEFLPCAGRHYANSRNYDDGVPTDGMRQNVSQLSPWLHACLISEVEVVEAVLDQHSPDASDKFIAEVFWRVYFKGYLEQRPTIWGAYCDQRDAAMAQMASNSGLQRAYGEATEGRTGIAAFDHWARELAETGYLHNHARMWFASIWIFTLKLDWTLGADFFLRHLIDGDAASNTLSWRWVGGLHTKGKTYLARADNIARYTANQNGGPLTVAGLAEDAPALHEDTVHGRQVLKLPPAPPPSAFDVPYALLLHDEAASHVPLNLPKAPSLIIGAARPDARSSEPVGDLARDFAHGSVESGAGEAAQAFGCEAKRWGEAGDLAGLLKDAGIDRILVPYLPVGWTRDALMADLAPLIEGGNAAVLLDDLRRTTWPHAKAGFFGVKKKIESVLGEIGVAA